MGLNPILESKRVIFFIFLGGGGGGGCMTAHVIFDIFSFGFAFLPENFKFILIF